MMLFTCLKITDTPYFINVDSSCQRTIEFFCTSWWYLLLIAFYALTEYYFLVLQKQVQTVLDFT